MRKYFRIGLFILTILQVSCLENRKEKNDSAGKIKHDFDNMSKFKDSIEREVIKKNPSVKEKTDKIIEDIFKKIDEEKKAKNRVSESENKKK